MGLGAKIYNWGIRKRNESIEKRKREKPIKEQAKKAEKEAYYSNLEKNMNEAAQKRGEQKARLRANQPPTYKRIAQGTRNVLSAMPTLKNPDDPFFMQGSQQHRKKKKKRNTPNYFANLP